MHALASVMDWVLGHPIEETFQRWLPTCWVCHVRFMTKKCLALASIIIYFGQQPRFRLFWEFKFRESLVGFLWRLLATEGIWCLPDSGFLHSWEDSLSWYELLSTLVAFKDEFLVWWKILAMMGYLWKVLIRTLSVPGVGKSSLWRRVSCDWDPWSAASFLALTSDEVLVGGPGNRAS